MSILRAAHAGGLSFLRFQIRTLPHPCLSSPCKTAPRRGYAERVSQVSGKSRRLLTESVGPISTLDPDKITSKDYLDLSQPARHVLRTSANAVKTEKRRGKNCTFVSNRISMGRGDCTLSFANKTGFLYYHQEIAQNPLSGGLRFRLADDPSITAFHAGKDLLFSRIDLPWRISLLQIVKSPNLSPLLAQLMQDGLVTDESVSKCRRLNEFNRGVPLVGRQSQIIYSFDEPFILNLDQERMNVSLLDADLGRIWSIQSFQVKKYPYVGKCIVRLEEVTSKSSDTAKPPFKTVKFRIVKVIEPFRWRDPVLHRPRGKFPEEGSLIGRGIPLVDRFRGGPSEGEES